MDDLQLGSRNKRGDWAPTAAVALPGIWRFPLTGSAVLGWLRGYLVPWNLVFMLTTLVYWQWLIPGTAEASSLQPAWVARLLLANWLGLLLFYGGFELRLYVRRRQGAQFKYNGKFPADQHSDVFWFKRQNLDNFLRSFLVSIPIGTAIEAGLLWAFASGQVPTLAWSQHPATLLLWVALAPVLHELHFFCIHRAIHWGPLYRWVHAVHHNSINPTPWSSLSMHPVESAAYFGVALWTLAIPAHPFVAVWLFHLAAFGGIVGHIGFDRITAGHTAVATGSYPHYLHHKFFEVNYCDGGYLPLDHWLGGSWHDGSVAAAQRMQARFERKRARVNAASESH